MIIFYLMDVNGPKRQRTKTHSHNPSLTQLQIFLFPFSRGPVGLKFHTQDEVGMIDEYREGLRDSPWAM